MKNLEQVIESITKNGGATFNPNFTDNEGNFKSVNDGYMVSLPNMESKNQDLKKGLQNLMGNYSLELIENRNLYFGVWLNKLDGFYYFDISENFNSLKFAITTGMKANQIAIYDVAKDKEIVLPTNQTSGTTTQKNSYINGVVKNYLTTGSFYSN